TELSDHALDCQPAGQADVRGRVVKADMDVLAAPDAAVEIVGLGAVVVVAGDGDAVDGFAVTHRRPSPRRGRRSPDSSLPLPPESRRRNGCAGSRLPSAASARIFCATETC